MQTVDDVTQSSCKLFTRSHAGHISKLTVVFQCIQMYVSNVLANVMNIASDGLEIRQTDNSS